MPACDYKNLDSIKVNDDLGRISNDFPVAFFWRGEGINSNVSKFRSVKKTNQSNVPGFTILYICHINSIWIIVEFLQCRTELIDLLKLCVGRVR